MFFLRDSNNHLQETNAQQSRNHGLRKRNTKAPGSTNSRAILNHGQIQLSGFIAIDVLP